MNFIKPAPGGFSNDREIYDICIGATVYYDCCNVNDKIMCPIHTTDVLVTVDHDLDKWITDNFPESGYGYQSCPPRDFWCNHCDKFITIVFGDYCG